MPMALRAEPLRHGRTFAVWRVVVWLLLLLAAFGCLQYFRHAELLWTQRQALASSVEASAALRVMLAWDIAYLLAAMVLIVLCAGCILRQAWARPALRVAAGLLALWMLASGVAMLVQWPAFEHASADALGQLHGDVALRQALVQARHTYLAALVLKAVAVPVLLWLAWSLGCAGVRAQFRRRH